MKYTYYKSEFSLTFINYIYSINFYKIVFILLACVHVKIIHVLNIHIDLFLWVYDTHEIFNMNIIQHEHLLPLYC